MTEDSGFSNWIGRKDQSPPETVTQPALDRFCATLAPHVALTTAVPAGLHWCLSPATVPAEMLGPDGHPAKGGFLPPIPLPRRMWAGGEIAFHDPLRIGDAVTRLSRIADIRKTSGRSGPLWFVAVDHDYSTPHGLAIRERQDIVYRAAATAEAARPAPSTPKDPPALPDAEWRVQVDPVLLFRYSALTFNAHRIHYDEPYARTQEFYPGLVIHGPLQATLLLNLAAAQGGRLPARFAFRGTSPATGAQILRCRAWNKAEGCELAVVSASGATTMTARATW